MAVLTLILFAATLQAQDLNATLKRIFENKEFKAKSFGPARWIDKGAAYTTVESTRIVRYNTATGAMVSSVQADPLTIADYAWSPDKTHVLIFTNTKKVWRQNTRGDYWVLDLNSDKRHKLGGDGPPSTLMFAKFSPDGKRAAYVRNNDIFVEEIDSGSIRQLTHDGSPTSINGTSDWVYEEELSIRDGFRWSPDGKRIAFWHFDSTGVGNFSLINNTDATYPTVTLIPYPKVGTTNSAASIGVVSSTGGKIKWMQIPGDARDNYIASMDWAGPGEIVVQHLNRLQNVNDVMIADATSGAVRSVFRDQDKAWVDVVDEIRWINDQSAFTWLSERDGWRRAYVVSRDAKSIRPVTPPGVDVIRLVTLDDQEKWLYYTASPENATQRYLYRARLDGSGTAQRITPQGVKGTHSYQIAPDGQWAIHTYSAFDRTPVTDLVRLPSHETVRMLQDNAALRSAAEPLVTSATEFFKVDVGDGVVLDGWMIRPANFDPSKKYPLLMHVYGEPASVTVVDQWGGPRALFHRALADEGYVIASVDNRGTPAPKGREWRKVVYGAVGVLSAKEQAAAVRELLRTRSYLDPARVGVWGWSGGGSNTLNCMFRYPDIYKVGVSVAPVPDQRLYDTIYQERYMGLPKDNPDGYRDGSPLSFSEGLEGRLLIVHGTGDDNVHYQGFEKQVNRLIELGKRFDVMTYPNRTHSISEGKGTSLHLHSLIARYFKENL